MLSWFQRRQTIRQRPTRRLLSECLETRRLLASIPLGATARDTGEFMLGRVAVTPVLFESDGTLDTKTQSWSPAEIDEFLEKLVEGTSWWTETLGRITDRHELEFVIDPTFATTPFSTPYEPIERTSDAFELYAKEFLTAQGVGANTSLQESVFLFNDAQRQKLQTDWSFTIFVADASDHRTGQFATGGAFSTAFAFAGGQFIVMPSTRPASTITHEMGHIFWARDEYPGGGSWTDRRGYYDTQNWNAANNPTPGFRQEISIMRGGAPLQEAYVNHVSPDSTLAMIGWQDSDGDGVFDLADVPLSLTARGSFDATTSVYRLVGSAAAVPLLNRNSSGNQSDITLNRVTRIEYSLDDGPWVSAFAPDLQIVESFDISVELPEFSVIRWRAIDAVTGITSEVLEATPLAPALSQAGLRGHAFIDANANGVRDASEQPLAGVKLRITRETGEDLFGGEIAAGDFSDADPVVAPGISLTAETLFGSESLVSMNSPLAGNARLFAGYNPQSSGFSERWSSRMALRARFDEPTGEVSVSLRSFSANGYGRIEGYDAQGNLIARATTSALARSATSELTLVDAEARITSVKIFGHSNTDIGIESIRYGSSHTVTTDEFGTYRIPNLSAGDYRISIETPNVIYAPGSPSFVESVGAGVSNLTSLAIGVVASPLHNRLVAEDANGDGQVTASDALAILNDLNVNGARLLQPGEGESVGTWVDVNNDGRSTALDALMVINWLNVNQTPDFPAGGEAAADTPTNPGLFSPFEAATPDPSVFLKNRAIDAVWAAWEEPVDLMSLTERIGDDQPDRSLIPAGESALLDAVSTGLVGTYSPASMASDDQTDDFSSLLERNLTQNLT